MSKTQPSWTIRISCCLKLEMTLGSKYLWTEGNLSTICSIQREHISWYPFQLWQRKMVEKNNGFLMCLILPFSKKDFLMLFPKPCPPNVFWGMSIGAGSTSLDPQNKNRTWFFKILIHYSKRKTFSLGKLALLVWCCD